MTEFDNQPDPLTSASKDRMVEDIRNLAQGLDWERLIILYNVANDLHNNMNGKARTVIVHIEQEY